MSDPRRSGDDTPIADDVAERILATAAALDERRESDERGEHPELTVAQLRAAALEAGISEEAFDLALAAIERPDTPTTPRVPVRGKSRLRALVTWSGIAGGAIGLSWGVLGRSAFSEAAFSLALGTGIGASAYLALRFRSGRRLGSFVIGTLFLWLYMVAGLVVASGLSLVSLGMVPSLVGRIVAGCLAVGAAIVRAPSLTDDSDDAGLAVTKPHSR